jgi:transposase
MKIFREYSQGQGFLLPPSLCEFVPENHEARIFNDLVDTMDLFPLFAKSEGGGVPAYHPTVRFKLIILAYSRDIHSYRSITQELKRDTAFIFLSGLQSSVPISEGSVFLVHGKEVNKREKI